MYNKLYLVTRFSENNNTYDDYASNTEVIGVYSNRDKAVQSIIDDMNKIEATLHNAYDVERCETDNEYKIIIDDCFVITTSSYHIREVPLDLPIVNEYDFDELVADVVL